MITEITGEKGDGEHGVGRVLELPWFLHAGTTAALLPGVPALDVRFQQLLPQRAPGSNLPFYATCLSWDGASHGSFPGLHFPICNMQEAFAALRRIWESCRL